MEEQGWDALAGEQLEKRDVRGYSRGTLMDSTCMEIKILIGVEWKCAVSIKEFQTYALHITGDVLLLMLGNGKAIKLCPLCKTPKESELISNLKKSCFREVLRA